MKNREDITIDPTNNGGKRTLRLIPHVDKIKKNREGLMEEVREAGGGGL